MSTTFNVKMTDICFPGMEKKKNCAILKKKVCYHGKQSHHTDLNLP